MKTPWSWLRARRRISNSEAIRRYLAWLVQVGEISANEARAMLNRLESK